MVFYSRIFSVGLVGASGAGKTTLAIAHRLSTLRNMNKIVVMKDGRIIECGQHDALLRKRGEYARLWKMQSGGFYKKKNQ